MFRENVFSKDPGQRTCPEEMGPFLAVEENAEDDGRATRPSRELYGTWHRQLEDSKQEIMKIKMAKFPMSKFCQITASNNTIKSTGFVVAVVIGFKILYFLQILNETYRQPFFKINKFFAHL